LIKIFIGVGAAIIVIYVVFYIFLLNSHSFTDKRDGRKYSYTTIGIQTWMTENLAYLPTLSHLNSISETVNHYYVYGYEGTNISEAKATANFINFGVLYNWPAAISSCPDGWHLPSDQEFKILEV